MKFTRQRKLTIIHSYRQTLKLKKFKPNSNSNLLYKKYSKFNKLELENKFSNYVIKIAGRIISHRDMGRALFITIQDQFGDIQIYISKNYLIKEHFEIFKKHNTLGDIIGVNGTVFKTNTGQLSIKIKHLITLAKSLHLIKKNYHGIIDKETCYRQRYLDLIINKNSKKKFIIRSKIIQYIRDYFNNLNFLEVETPMMHSIPGGASANSFTTYHQALNIPLFLRIAPELYLKRLVVGGFERVYEINRNFRNEGLSTKHNPEFTMLEFYQAYSDYKDLMKITEKLLKNIAKKLLNTTTIVYGGQEYDLSKSFTRISMFKSILKYNSQITKEQLNNLDKIRNVANNLKIKIEKSFGLGKIQSKIFETCVESKLSEPTFITCYPIEISPLAQRSKIDPNVAERFELFINGFEIANGFSELNDPIEQNMRFYKQEKYSTKSVFDKKNIDYDYIRALEYGMPPTAGEGIGIDRLIMFFTDSSSIKDVLLFPYMRPNF